MVYALIPVSWEVCAEHGAPGRPREGTAKGRRVGKGAMTILLWVSEKQMRITSNSKMRN